MTEVDGARQTHLCFLCCSISAGIEDEYTKCEKGKKKSRYLEEVRYTSSSRNTFPAGGRNGTYLP